MLLLALGAYWALVAINATWPRRRPALLSVVSFFPAWLLTERLPLRLVGQVLLAGGLAVWLGLAGVASIVGALLCLLAWALELRLLQASLRAASTTRQAMGRLGPWLEAARPPRTGAPLGRGARWHEMWIPWPIRPAGVERIRDVVYREVEGRPLRLDVIRARSRPARGPALLFLHGGAWVIGSKREQGLPLQYALAELGFVCFSADYRLAPRARLFEAVTDAKAAVAWIRRRGADYGAAPEFLAVAGGSAGAHLAALVALTPGDPRFQPGFEREDTHVSALVGFYGVYDLLEESGRWPNRGMERLLARRVMQEDRVGAEDLYRACSPYARVGPDAPPALLLHGALDPLAPVESARAFARRLEAASGAHTAYVEYPGAGHAFEVFPSLRCVAAVQGAARFLCAAWVADKQSGERV